MLITKNVGSFSEGMVGDELMLMQIDTGTFHGLSGVGLAIWRLLNEHSDREAIVEILAERYDVDPATCATDVQAFLGELERAGFVTAA